MTIGRVGHDYDTGPNPDFEVLQKTREQLYAQLAGLERGRVELSMGMSTDYERAVAAGSSNVRVGSVIFGARATKHWVMQDPTCIYNHTCAVTRFYQSLVLL